MLVEKPQLFGFDQWSNQCCGFNFAPSRNAAVPMFNCMAIGAQRFEVLKRIIFAIAVAVVNNKRRRITFAASFTGKSAYPVHRRSKTAYDIRLRMHCSVEQPRALPGTEPALFTLEILSSHDGLAAHHAFALLMTRPRTIFLAALVQVACLKALAAGRTRFDDIAVGVATFSRAITLALTASRIVPLELFAAYLAGIHSGLSFAGFADGRGEQAAKLAFRAGSYSALAHRTILPQGVI